MVERPGSFGAYFREALKSPIVIFALVILVVLAVGAPFFAISD